MPDVIDYEKLAASFGLNGYRTNSLDGLKEALIKAAASERGSLIVCDISTGQDVFPMVPPGNAMHDQVFSENDI